MHAAVHSEDSAEINLLGGLGIPWKDNAETGLTEAECTNWFNVWLICSLIKVVISLWVKKAGDLLTSRATIYSARMILRPVFDKIKRRILVMMLCVI
jgi:hypothetical protein